MGKFLKGQDVKLKANIGTSTTEFSLLGQETECSLSFNINTIDASNKSDSDPEFEHAEYDNTELSAQVNGNVKDVTEVKTLLACILGTLADSMHYNISAVLGTGEQNNELIKTNINLGSANPAVMTSLEIDMPAEGLATVSATLECGSDFYIQ